MAARLLTYARNRATLNEKEPAEDKMKKPPGRKDDRKMKIAVTYENGEVFQHFGHCESFKLYETQDGKVTEETVVSAQGSGHGALAGFLQAHGVEALICGGIGMGARMALDDAGIRLYPGVQGNADEAVAALLSGSLNYDPDAQCSHHHDHGEGHTCGHGDHECGHGHEDHGCGHGDHGCGEDKHGCAGNH